MHRSLQFSIFEPASCAMFPFDAWCTLSSALLQESLLAQSAQRVVLSGQPTATD